MMAMYPKYSHNYGITDILYCASGFFIDYSVSLGHKLREIFGVKHVLFLDSGRSVLNLGLKSLIDMGKLKQGDEVAIPVDLCHVAVELIIKNGLIPLFIDIDNNLTMSTEDLRKKMTKKTKAVMPVYNYGNVPKMDEICRIAETNKAAVIEDKAPAFNAKYKGRTAGNFGLFGFLSLDVTKHISAFNGGILLTNDYALYAKIKEEIDEINKNQNKREGFFENIKRMIKLKAFIIAANNMVYGLFTRRFISHAKNMSYYQPKNMLLSKAAIALAYSQVKKIDKINSFRKMNAMTLMAGLKTYACVQKDRKPTYQFLPVLVKNKNKILHYLENEKKLIDLPRPVPLLIHMHEYHKYHNKCPNAEEMRKKLILLPTYRKIKDIVPKLCGIINRLEKE